MTIATTILEQLGGNKFRVMTGAKNFLGNADSLMFSLPTQKDYVKEGINRVRITLNGNDEYKMEFFRVWGVNCKPIHTLDGIQAEQLQEMFKSYTGLDTKL